MRTWILLSLGLLAAGEARADWVRCADDIDISNYKVVIDSHWLALAAVSAEADGDSTSLGGSAVDMIGSFTEAGAGVAVNGAHYECWKHEPDEFNVVGEVEYGADLSLWGIAELLDPDCAGMASGYERADAFIDGSLESSGLVALDHVAGETVGGVLTPLGIKIPGPWGVSIPAAISITVGSGAGKYEQVSDSKFNKFVCPVITYEFATQTQSVGQVWADEDIGFEALVRVRAKGTIFWNCSRLEFPICPPGTSP